MASLSADVLNYILYRYLLESGFTHSAFNFRHEAGIDKYPFDGNLIQPAALVQIIQLGLQFKEMEANSDNDADEVYYVLPLMDLITKDAAELKKLVKENMENLNDAGGKDLNKGKQGSHSHVEVKLAKDPKKQAVLIVGDDGVRRPGRRLRKG